MRSFLGTVLSRGVTLDLSPGADRAIGMHGTMGAHTLSADVDCLTLAVGLELIGSVYFVAHLRRLENLPSHETSAACITSTALIFCREMHSCQIAS
jgi:hypothetical protein